MGSLKTALVGTLLSAVVLCPRPAPAMEMQMFDEMAAQDQRDYLTFLVKHAQKVFTAQGQPDLAVKVRQLFREGRDHRSLGRAQFEENLAVNRDAIAWIVKNQSPLGWPPVESALIMTLYKNGIQTSFAFHRGLKQAIREQPYWPKLPLQQRSWPDGNDAGPRPGSGSSLHPES
jgi:hypothetical protein